MAHFSDCVAQCSDPYCRQHDFLPATCDGCNKVFCSDHFSYSAHACEHGRSAKDRRAAVCQACGQSIPYAGNEDESKVLERHLASGSCRPASVASKPRCPVQGCKEKLTVLNSFACPKCNTKVCMKHRFEEDHDCNTRQLPKSRVGRPSSGGQPCRDVPQRDRKGFHRNAAFSNAAQVLRRLAHC